MRSIPKQQEVGHLSDQELARQVLSAVEFQPLIEATRERKVAEYSAALVELYKEELPQALSMHFEKTHSYYIFKDITGGPPVRNCDTSILAFKGRGFCWIGDAALRDPIYARLLSGDGIPVSGEDIYSHPDIDIARLRELTRKMAHQIRAEVDVVRSASK